MTCTDTRTGVGASGTLEEYFSKSEVAKAWHMSSDTVDRMVARGELRAYRIGPRSVRFKKCDVEGIIQPVPSAADFR